MSFPGPS